MTTSKDQIELFGEVTRYEYYPVLLLDSDSHADLQVLNQELIALGFKPSQLTKLPHVSLDGKVCEENDQQIRNDLVSFLKDQKALVLKFTGISQFPGRGGVTSILRVENEAELIDFNQKMMQAIGGKVTKLKNLHLTLARYVNPDLQKAAIAKDSGPRKYACNSVAIYKKKYNAKGPYEVIGTVEFDDLA